VFKIAVYTDSSVSGAIIVAGLWQEFTPHVGGG